MSNKTVALVVIGDEILSGRTQDLNVQNLAKSLAKVGITLAEVRMISDMEKTIADTVNDVRKTYDYVFTSGGIGPTHDDITADSIGVAFGLPVEKHPDAVKLLGDYYDERGIEFTEARQRMTRMPVGAKFIKNRISVAPGFMVENVYVMAGVPSIFSAMVDEVIPTLEHGKIWSVKTLQTNVVEGTFSPHVAEISHQYPTVSIGSYPKMNVRASGNVVDVQVQLVIRAEDGALVDTVASELTTCLLNLGGTVDEI